jgi:membrane fusion protein (multidrug efflux system)
MTFIKQNYWILLLSGITLLGCADTKTTEEAQILSPLVKLETAQVKTFVHKISVQGNVETEKDVLLNAEMGGLVIQVHVRSGDKVTAGQTLVTLDGAMLSSSAEELKTQLEYAEYMLQKQEELKKRGVGSEFDYKTALNQVNALKTKLNSLNVQRGKMAIRAPFSGVIDEVYAKSGQMAGPQAPLMRLVNNTKVDITASISEKHLAKVSIGTPILVSFPNFQDTSMQLKITSVGNYIEPTNRTFRIVSTINNNKLLLPNMLAKVEITDVAAENALVIPSKSIIRGQDNQEYVFVARAKGKEYELKKINVNVLERYEGEAMIEQVPEIQKGTLIVVEGARGITEKDIVRTK